MFIRTTITSISLLVALSAATAQAGLKEAEQLYAAGDHKAALQEYVNTGGEGDIEATFRAAQMFERGEGTGEPKLDKAAAWYQAAARAGHVSALKALAEMFAEGRGVDEDKVQAWALLDIAAQKGDSEAAQVRDELSADLRPGQVAAGQRRAQKLAPKYETQQGS